MDEEEQLIGQMGLLLTQVRYARRALEDIERNTATYGGIAVLEGMMTGERFGAPPLLNGALKVYIVNIQDLVAGQSLGGVIEGLFGGIGRLFGGFLGGIVGGTIGGVVTLGGLPWVVADLAAIADRVERIVTELNLGELLNRPTPRNGGGTNTDSDSGSSSSFMDALPPITDALLGLTALFRAAAGGPGDTSGPTGAQTAALDQMQRFLQPIYAILNSVAHVVDGLIILVPNLVGAFASFLDKIDVLKLQIVEFLQFIVRNVFLLRGVVLVTLYDTLSTAASLASELLRIVAQAVDRILEAIFNAIGQALQTLLRALQFVAGGIARTVDSLLSWLVRALHAGLTILGETPIFRVFYHIVDILPDVLPALVELIHGRSLSDPLSRAGIASAQAATLPSLTSPGTPGTPGSSAPPIPPFPNIADSLMPPAALLGLQGDIASLGTGMRATAQLAFSEAQLALTRIGRRVDQEGFEGRLQERFTALRQQSDRLASAFDSARTSAAAIRDPRVHAVATAYESWLTGGGLRTIMERITEHFRQTPPSATASIPGRIATDTALERARATVEIDEVVVELTPPTIASGDAGGPLDRTALLDEILDAWYDRVRRGARPGPDTLAFA